jgi:hypothetical protein
LKPRFNEGILIGAIRNDMQRQLEKSNSSFEKIGLRAFDE